jgi:spore coat protein A
LRSVATRKLILQEGVDALGRIQPILGELGNYAGYAFDAPATETPVAGTTEIWEIYNLTGDAHPIHFHMVNGQVLGRQRINVVEQQVGEMVLPTFAGFSGVGRPADPNEQGWKETVRMNPGEMTKMIFDFTLPPFAQPENIPPFGNGHHYVWHCHILEHEEHDMMRPMIVTT